MTSVGDGSVRPHSAAGWADGGSVSCGASPPVNRDVGQSPATKEKPLHRKGFSLVGTLDLSLARTLDF